MNIGSPTPVSVMDPFRQTTPVAPEPKRPDETAGAKPVTAIEAVPAKPLPAAVGKGVGIFVDVTM